MPKNHDLHVKLDVEEKKKIVDKAQNAGKSISQFVKDLAFNDTGPLDAMIKEIHNAVVGVKNADKKVKSRTINDYLQYSPAEEYAAVDLNYNSSAAQDYNATK